MFNSLYNNFESRSVLEKSYCIARHSKLQKDTAAGLKQQYKKPVFGIWGNGIKRTDILSFWEKIEESIAIHLTLVH